MRLFKNNIRLLLGLTIVALSLLLVFVVGYAQALKSYRLLTMETVVAQTEAARLGIEQILSSGVPLTDIGGLNQVLQPIVDSDESVTGLRLVAGQAELYRFGDAAEDQTSLSIPLNNKFSQVGTLYVVLSDQVVTESVTKSFYPMLWFIAVLLLVFIGSVLKSSQRKVYLTSFTLVFFTMALAVIVLVGSLYRDGLQSKAVSLADVVSQRLAPILEYNVDKRLINGVETMLDNFRHAHPEVAEIAVYNSDTLVANSQQEAQIVPILSETNALDYSIMTSEFGEVRLSYQAEIVVTQLALILKNFAILFFSCGLVCFVFIRLLSGEVDQSSTDSVLERIKPLFLGAVLMEALMVPIMPQYLTSIAQTAGMGTSASALFFTLYFLGFALTLLPAARFIEIYNIRRVLIVGILLSSLGCVLLAFGTSIEGVLAARLISGIGQALIFISVQGYIFRFSDKKNKTQAAGIIVFCFNAGFITGAAIGALLANYLGDQGIFVLAACIGIGMAIFSLILPSMKPNLDAQGSLISNVSGMLRDSWHLLHIPAFVRTMLLVGIPTKAALTGIVFFAVPLLLAQQGISEESIGQVLMAYAVVVLVSSHKVGPWVDKLGSSKVALSLGSFLAALSLAVLAFSLTMDLDWQVIVFMTLSMMIMGLSHGLINAPVVTHVVTGAVNLNDSDSTTAATYRFLERFGHVLGSLVVGQMIISLGAVPALLTLAGFFIFAFLLFVIFDRNTAKGVKS